MDFARFGKLAADVFTAHENLNKATNKAILEWAPFITERMNELGVAADNEIATKPKEVAQVTFELMAAFFNHCPKAMDQLRQAAQIQGLGFTGAVSVAHLRSIIKKAKWSGTGSSNEYVFKKLNELFNEMGYRQRDVNAAEKARREKREKGEGEQAIPPKDTAQPIDAYIIPKSLKIGDAIIELLKQSGEQPGAGYVAWAELMYAVGDTLFRAGADNASTVDGEVIATKGELVAA